MEQTREPNHVRPFDQVDLEIILHNSPGPNHDQRCVPLIPENPKCKIFMI